MRKIGEDVTETLEVVPHQWKVIKARAGEVLRIPPPSTALRDMGSREDIGV